MKLSDPSDMNNHLLHDGKGWRIAWSQKTGAALDRNKKIRDMQEGRPFASDTEHLASIPSIIYEKWMREFNLSWPPTQDDLDFVLSKVRNDPDFRYFRTSGSR